MSYVRVPIIVAVLWSAVNAVGQLVDWHDEAISHLVLVSSTAAALLALVLWPAFLRRLPKTVRFAPLAVMALAAGLFFSRYSLRFTGGMHITVVDRWAPTDASLAIGEDIKVAPGERTAAPVAGPRDFPQFLGPTRNGVVKGLRLARDWSERPPRLVWRQPIGAGWSAFAAIGPWAVTQEQRGGDEMVTCYEVATGKFRWTHTDRVRFSAPHIGLGDDGPRATPTIDDGLVYTVGATGILNCLDFVSGERLWTRDIISDNDAEVDYWGKAASPLVVDDMVVVSAGGPKENSLVAYHKHSGQRLWGASGGRSSYASPTLMTLAGVRQIVVVNEKTITAHDPATGRMLWEHDWDGSSSGKANTTQPHQVADNLVFISKGYRIGGQLFQVERMGTDSWTTDTIWPEEGAGRRVMKSKLSNVAIRDGYVYGLDDGTLQCIELATGESQWKRGRFEHGQQLLVEDLLLVMAENTGELNLIEATPYAYRLLGTFAALGPTKAWNNLCLVGPFLLVRNDQEAACYELPLAEPQ